ncbi:RBL3 [Symbiodinium necroappetens]|uniref:Rhomboid-like protease n=1 Tax=Symbiodinium necroappetens TaxID=1628268 RepID=A0A813C7R9_9DINO|nr:RBL3 [Symbiodinium necroappetens]
MTTVVAVSNPTPRAQVLGVSDVSFDECCEGRLLGGDHSSDCPRLRRLPGQHDQMARDQEVAMAMQDLKEPSNLMAAISTRQSIACQAHDKRTQTCRELISRLDHRVQPGCADRDGAVLIHRLEPQHAHPGQQRELCPEKKDWIQLEEAQVRRWGTSKTMLPQYRVLHARRSARTSPRTEMPRPSPHTVQARLPKKPRSRPSSVTPRSPRKDEGRKRSEQEAPVRSLARARCWQKMGFAKFPLHVALAIPDCPDADRTQSGPWRRASDRASKEIRASKSATPLREARRALEALASAALAATLRCSRSQELTTCLLRRVLAESAELEQLAELLRAPSAPSASLPTAHARVVEILEEAKEANRLLGQALRALGADGAEGRRWGRQLNLDLDQAFSTEKHNVEKLTKRRMEPAEVAKPGTPAPDEPNARCTVMAALNELVSGMRQALDDIHQLRQDAVSESGFKTCEANSTLALGIAWPLPSRIVSTFELIDHVLLASLPQAEEFHQAEAARAEAALRMPDITYSVVDPLWGEVTTTEAPSAWFRLLFCCCPCCVVGCSTKEAKRAWVKFLCSCSFILAVLQVAILVAVIAVDGGMVSYEENPMLGPKFNRLDEAGGKNAAKILLHGDWWRLASATMLHAGWIHLAGNLVVQLHAGVQLEVIWGPTAWLVVYFVSGIYANLLSCVLHPDTIGVGSSGCLCGLIGGWLSFIFITWNQTLPSDIKMRNAQVTSIVLSILMVLVFSFLPLMDFAAHVGGLLMGTGTSMVMFGSRPVVGEWMVVQIPGCSGGAPRPDITQ